MKRIALLYIILLPVLFSCGNRIDSINMSYKINGSDIRVQSVEKGDPQLYSFEWIDVSEYSILDNSSLVVSGTIEKTQDVSITYFNTGGTKLEAFFNLLDIKVDKVYYSKDESIPSNIIVHCLLSSRTQIAEGNGFDYNIGNRYCFVLEKTEGNKINRLGYEKFCDYFIAFPPIDEFIKAPEAPVGERLASVLSFNAQLMNKGISFSPFMQTDECYTVLFEGK